MEKNKYFVKWLPVEGEIKEGDTIWLAGQGFSKATKDGVFYKAYFDSEKVKLFLCTRDVKNGDKVKSSSILNGQGAWSNSAYIKFNNEKFRQVIAEEEEFTISETIYTNGTNCFNTKEGAIIPYHAFKVLGEISPDATFVKEGDEFNREDVIGELIYFDAFGEASSHYKPVEEAIKERKYNKNEPGSKRGMFFRYIEIKCKCCNKFT